MDFPEYEKIDPRWAKRVLSQHFSSSTPDEVVARAQQLTPEPVLLDENGLGLAQILSDVSWRLMIGQEDVERLDEAMIYAKNVCDHLDEAAALLSSAGAIPRQSERWGVQAKRMLVSYPRIRRALEALMSSEKYGSLKASVERVVTERERPTPAQLDEYRQFFASLSLLMEEA